MNIFFTKNKISYSHVAPCTERRPSSWSDYACVSPSQLRIFPGGVAQIGLILLPPKLEWSKIMIGVICIIQVHHRACKPAPAPLTGNNQFSVVYTMFNFLKTLSYLLMAKKGGLKGLSTCSNDWILRRRKRARRLWLNAARFGLKGLWNRPFYQCKQ